MARFTFNLQTVLEEREREERLCQKALGEASMARQQAEDELAEVEREISGNNELMRDNHLVGKLDATADRKAGVLRVNALHRDVPFTKEMTTDVEAEIESLAGWLGLSVVR